MNKILNSPKHMTSILVLSNIFSIITMDTINFKEKDFLSCVLQLLVNSLVLIVFSFVLYFFNKDKNINLHETLSFKNNLFTSFNYFLLFLISFIFFINISKHFVDFMSTEVYTKNDSFKIAFLFFLIITYTLYNGINSLSKCSTFVIFCLYSFLFFLFLISIKNFDFSYLNEINYNEIKINKNDIIFNFFNTFEFILLLYFIKFLSKDKKIYFSFILKSFIVIFVLYFISYFTLGKFLKDFSYPFFSMSKVSNLSFFRRLDGFFIVIWTFISYIKITAVAFLIMDTINYFFRNFKKKPSILLVNFILFVIFYLFYFFNFDMKFFNIIYFIIFVYLFILFVLNIIFKRGYEK